MPSPDSNRRNTLLGRDALENEPDLPPEPDSTPQDPIATAYVRDSNSARVLVKLSRWQVALERSYYRAFDELQRLQQLRAANK